ncbi:hypothetical protein [Lactiplantibacillus plantarum]|uniref:hypothetical protein n=1 Tax=Lactiplantibacillus plantarum TaxID=1590 RepID=UPI002237CE69|nr:hypothetical protein [Lactiplantibacillus plantarum]MCW6101532.1 hypothetical protein [Lactiplantibacillus plantarum]MCW6104659.1 hypothetical protein [Lactiplantibacillus plantarum]
MPFIDIGAKSVKNSSKTIGTSLVNIDDVYNQGFREFLLSIVLPMISTYPIIDSPIMSFTMVVILQILVYFFFINSSDIFPNLTLAICGYYIYTGSDNTGKKYFVFGRRKNIADILKSRVEAIPFSGGSENNIMIVKEK